MQSLSIEEFGLGDVRIREFALLPWRLYRGDPYWTPPLNADLLGNRLLGTKGLLTAAHPYHKHAEVTHFLARRGGKAVGRISAAINRRFNDYYGAYSALGSFGFFEVEDDYEAASALLDAARDWIAARGMTAMRGPGEYSNATHERQGVLIDGFDTPPTVDCTHNPPFYGEFLERWGLSKVKDYHAYIVDMATVPAERLAAVADAVRERSHVQTRTVNMKDFNAEVGRIIDVYNRAWANNWGFLPVTPEEADTVADTLRPIVDPGLIRFATVDDEVVASLGAFPDPNWALRPRWGLLGDSDPVRLARLLAMRRHIPRVRLMFFGIAPGYRMAGIDALLFDETYRYAVTRGYKTIEASLLLEDNDLILRPSQYVGGRRYKTWRIYERSLES
ncbi:MAG: N-acetyltransferase [Coriobacteriia bacterium]|nr:N-acetyltransferase [Coriobacteriia bacterium]